MPLTQIPGLTGWFDADGLKRPCRTCGGTLFWAYRWGLRCVKCIRLKRGEVWLGMVDLEHLELGLQKGVKRG